MCLRVCVYVDFPALAFCTRVVPRHPSVLLGWCDLLAAARDFPFCVCLCARRCSCECVCKYSCIFIMELKCQAVKYGLS